MDPGSGGATVRTLEDSGNIHWPACVVSYATSVGTPDALQVVTTSAGLPVAQQGTWTAAATQSGTWTVQPGNTANTTAWLVTGTGGTFPATQSGTWNITNVSGTVSLPTGAATAAKQPALGTAGTASADVITVQGIASMTPLAASQSGTWNVGTVTTVTTVAAVTAITNALPAGTNNIGDVDVLTVPADPFGANADAASATGSISAKLRFIASTGIPITGTVTVGSHAVTNAGTFAVQVDGTALTRLTDIKTNTDSCAVVGNGAAATAQRVTLANDSTGVLATVSTVSTLTGGGVAHDAADSGSPHKVGAKATTALSGLTLVANADRTDLYAGIDGVLITRPYCNLEDVVTGVAAITDGSSTSVIASAGAGVKVYITSVIIANSSASNVTVDLRDGAAGSVKATFPAPANGGVVHTLPVPLPFSAATAVCADPSAAASTVTVTLIGFKSKV